jgi:hypothetical protein
MGIYNWLDLAPKGRAEEGMVPHPMAWVRHHDRYDSDYFASLAQSGSAQSPAAKKGSAAGCCVEHS